MGIFEEYFSPKLIAPLFEKLKSIRNDRNTELNALGNVFGDVEELAKFYIEPHCQHANPANEDEDEPVSIVASPVFNTINKFLNGDFAVRGDGRNVMYVLADAGMGKTSLLMMLKLSHLTSFWPKEYDCVLLKLGKRSVEDIRNIEGKQNTVLLLDALDEDLNAFGRVKERLLELVSELHNFRRVIITCRTQFFPNDEIDPYKRVGKIKIGGYVCPMFFLSLFDDYQVDKYLNKRFTDKQYILSAKKIIEDMGSLQFRPLLLAHIDGFMESSRTKWNEYTVFETLVDTWLMREEVKLKSLNSNLKHAELLDACITIAIQMHKRGLRAIHEKQLRDLRNEHLHQREDSSIHKEQLRDLGDEYYPELARISEIDIGGRSLLNKNSDDEFRFSHYSIQEFLIARGIVSNKITKPGTVKFTDKIFDFLELNNPDKKIFNELNYEGANLSGKNFENRDFSGVSLKGVNFSSSILSGAKFKGVDMSNSKFGNAKLVGVDMSGANLDGAVFCDAVLNDANLEKCSMKSVDFSCASMVKSKLNFSDLSNGTIRDADLTHSETNSLNIEGAVTVGAHLKGTSIMAEIYQERERVDNENIINV